MTGFRKFLRPPDFLHDMASIYQQHKYHSWVSKQFLLHKKLI